MGQYIVDGKLSDYTTISHGVRQGGHTGLRTKAGIERVELILRRRKQRHGLVTLPEIWNLKVIL